MVATSFHDASAASIVAVARNNLRAQCEADFREVKLHAMRPRFVTGVARAYEDDFPPELAHVVKETDFATAINQVNNTLKDYWPCFFCLCCGYACCPCTLGLSLLCPNLCVRDAEQYVRALLVRVNKRTCFERVGVEWRLVRSCGRSWIEISYPLVQKNPAVTYQNPNGTLEGSLSSGVSYSSHPRHEQPLTSSSSSSSSVSSPLMPGV